jgi:RNA recognition motif-containing protein
MKLYVGNLPFTTTENDLQEVFGQHGSVTSASIVMDRETGRSRGFAFVEMPNDAEAQAAITALNGQNFNGRDLTVNEARPKPAGERGGGGGGRRGGWGGGGGGGGGRRGGGGGSWGGGGGGGGSW